MGSQVKNYGILGEKYGISGEKGSRVKMKESHEKKYCILGKKSLGSRAKKHGIRGENEGISNEKAWDLR